MEDTVMAANITQLPQDVIDKIAAGEVVVRPVNAVKELIENSLDAGATEIRVEISQGGIELIRIQDNGHGIKRADMPLVCARFATSKLRAAEQLRSIGTFGFRGEALASISIVAARVQITSKLAEDKCAHRASYSGGKMVGDFMSLAGIPGTTITVDRLFHNAPARKAALRYPNEESNRIADLLVRYAIHYSSVSFSFRRLDGTGTGDFRSNGSGNQHSTVQALLHAKMTKDLINIEFHDKTLHFSVKACMASPVTLFTSTAIQSKQDRQRVSHLFINGRCVECPRLKQAMDAVFAAKDAYCPFITLSLEIEPSRVDVNVHPTKSIVHFLEQDRIIERIEQELHQLATQYHRRGTIELNLTSQKKNNETSERKQTNNGEETTPNSNKVGAERKRFYQRTIDHDHNLTTSKAGPNQSSISESPILPTKVSKKAPSKTRVRVDASNRTMEEFTELLPTISSPSAAHIDSPVLLRSQTFLNDNGSTSVSAVRLVPILDPPKNGEEEEDVVMLDDDDENLPKSGPSTSQVNSQPATTARSLPSSICSTPRHFEFQALVHLRREICRNADAELGQLFRSHYLIGFCDTRHALLQSGPSVYLVRCEQILWEFFYQLAIFSFGNMGAFELMSKKREGSTSSVVGDSGPLSIRQLLRMYLENEEDEEITKLIGTSKEVMQAHITDVCGELIKRKEMLWDFFSLRILSNGRPASAEEEDAKLCTLPCLLDGYLPQLASIPRLLYALGRHVDYSNEKKCYSSISRAFAELFTPYIAPNLGPDESDECEVDKEQELSIQTALRAVVFPALKTRFLPSSSLWGAVQSVTHIEQAFKQFGRC